VSTAPQHVPEVTVFIGDDTRMGCELMATALKRSRYKLTVIGSATDSAGICEGLRQSQSSVAIISARLKEGATAGFNVTREVRTSHPETSVIMMLDSIERFPVIEAVRAGATGIFSREERFELLCKCVHAVSQGQVWAGNKEMRFIIDLVAQGSAESTAPPISRGSNGLTKREADLVTLVAEGLTNRDISRQLNLSEHTVRNYLFRIFNKVGTSNRLELALYALSRKRDDTDGN
jgi:two-component system, NarL family, nitrate/nitrite response regulator NarL